MIKDKDIINDLKLIIKDYDKLIEIKNNIIETQIKVMQCTIESIETGKIHEVLPMLKSMMK